MPHSSTKPSKTTLAYLAGIIDGEGYVGWHKTTQTLVKGNKKSYFYPNIEVSMTTHVAIDLIHKYFGGSLRYRDNYKRERSPTYTVCLVNRQALAFAEAIRPYLLEKKDKADEIIEFYRGTTPRTKTNSLPNYVLRRSARAGGSGPSD